MWKRHRRSERFLQTPSSNRRRQGIPVQPFHFFELMLKHLFEMDLGFVMKAYQNTTCLAAAVFLKYQPDNYL